VWHAAPFNFDGLFDYLTSIACDGGKRSLTTAKSILIDIKNYFIFASSTPGCPQLEDLLNMVNLQQYLQHLQNDFQFAPTTLSEKIRRLILAMEYILHKENPDESNAAMFMQITKIINNLAKWKKNLSRDIKNQRNRQALLSTREVCTYILHKRCLHVHVYLCRCGLLIILMILSTIL